MTLKDAFNTVTSGISVASDKINEFQDSYEQKVAERKEAAKARHEAALRFFSLDNPQPVQSDVEHVW